jgi:FtsH-binding integral membrane protein
MHAGFRYGSVVPVSEAVPSARALFIRRTYAHLAGAIAAFAILEAYLLTLPIAKTFAAYSGNKFVWLGIIVAFMFVSYIADTWARSGASSWLQYCGLGLYVIAEAVIFVPLLTMAQRISPEIIPMAAILTGILGGGLTMICFSTKADYSGLRNVVAVGGFVALGLIFCSILFGFTLGLAFSAGMILLASLSILCSTSFVLYEYDTRQHVAAALSLFASIALLFWYMVRLSMELYDVYSATEDLT